jgi:quercetin dioxygenase-like cupin family protein
MYSNLLAAGCKGLVWYTMQYMDVKKFRWAKTYEAGEHELTGLLEAIQIDADRWSGEMSEEYEAHVHPKDKKLWCADGSITFTIGTKDIPLQAGDGLVIPANTMHSAVAGFMGCVCYEFPKQSDNPMLPA